MNTQPQSQPQLRAVNMSLFPQMDSLDEVMALAKSKVTCIGQNELHSLFMTFQNTLLKTLNEENQNTNPAFGQSHRQTRTK